MKIKLYCVDCEEIMHLHARWSNNEYIEGKKIKVKEFTIYECSSCGMRVREEVEID